MPASCAWVSSGVLAPTDAEGVRGDSGSTGTTGCSGGSGGARTMASSWGERWAKKHHVHAKRMQGLLETLRGSSGGRGARGVRGMRGVRGG